MNKLFCPDPSIAILCYTKMYHEMHNVRVWARDWPFSHYYTDNVFLIHIPMIEEVVDTIIKDSI